MLQLFEEHTFFWYVAYVIEILPLVLAVFVLGYGSQVIATAKGRRKISIMIAFVIAPLFLLAQSGQLSLPWNVYLIERGMFDSLWAVFNIGVWVAVINSMVSKE